MSLLGVTIGIFSIISVLTVVDSLEISIKDSLSILGSNVIYVDKIPFDAFSGAERYKWEEYFRRPHPSYSEYKFLKTNVNSHNGIAIISATGGVTLKYENNSYNGAEVWGGSYEYNELFPLELEMGRYFTLMEVEKAQNVAIIGSKLKENLFDNRNPLGESIKIKNQRFAVIAVMEEEGEDIFGGSSNDETVVIPYNSFRKMFRTGQGTWDGIRSFIGVKGVDTDEDLKNLENELQSLMRSRRGLKPKEKDNFALNRPEYLMNLISGIFSVISAAGWFIGGFAILVGGFGIANIMFVSVKERTNIIGIQKALGAKNYFILLQFLFEAIFLSIFGGLSGLLIVFLLTFISLGNLDLVLTPGNIILGLTVSGTIGIISGIVPAGVASRLDPVEAIRA